MAAGLRFRLCKTTKVLLTISLLTLLWFFVLVGFDRSLPALAQDEGETQELEQSIKTYFLNVLPQGSRQEVEINPSATKIVITSESGETAIRCGDGVRSYSCSPGKRLELFYEPDTPVDKFWAENQSEIQVRLRIDIYEQK